jgi:hypothetical protein
MRYKRAHTRNGVRVEAGTPYTGPVNTGRFLYQRGILEPDGGPDDHAIARAPGARARQRWGFEEDAAPPPSAPPAPTPSLDSITLSASIKE